MNLWYRPMVAVTFVRSLFLHTELGTDTTTHRFHCYFLRLLPSEGSNRPEWRISTWGKLTWGLYTYTLLPHDESETNLW